MPKQNKVTNKQILWFQLDHWWEKVQMPMPCMEMFPMYLHGYIISQYLANTNTLNTEIHRLAQQESKKFVLKRVGW